MSFQIATSTYKIIRNFINKIKDIGIYIIPWTFWEYIYKRETDCHQVTLEVSTTTNMCSISDIEH